MNSPDGNAPAMRLSLPSARDDEMAARVEAWFAAPVIAAARTEALPDLLLALGIGPDLPATAGEALTAVSPDPLALLALSVHMRGDMAEAVATACTRLLDAPYRGRPWGQHLQRLYDTSCPACWRPTMALAFRWQGAPPALVARTVACAHCGYQGEALAEAEDRARAAEIEPGRSLFWETMERVLPVGDPLRPRVEQVIQFYTPRNLWALWQSLRILRELALDQPLRRALQWLLARALWLGSSLADQPEWLWQTGVRRPRRFSERNLFLVLHEEVRRLREQPPGPDPSVHLVQRWPEQWAGLATVRAGLVLAAVPPPLPVYWLLRLAWSGWLFGREAVGPLLDLLTLRPGEWDFWQRRLRRSLRALWQGVAPGGHLAVQWRWRQEHDPSAAVLGALPRLSEPLRVAAGAEGEYVALAVVTKPASPPAARPEPTTDPIAMAATAMRHVITHRGEPVPAAVLRPHILAAWQQAGLAVAPGDVETDLETVLDPLTPPPGLTVVGSAGTPWEPGETAFWWTDEPPTPWQPLSDRTELTLVPLVQERSFPDADALAWALTLALPATLAPDRPWVEALIASYLEPTPTGLALKPQDDPARRRQECEQLARDLVTVGERMGFAAAAWTEDGLWTVEWQQDGRRRAGFVVSSTTALTPRLWRSRVPIPGLMRFLVLPGSRAGLVQWRLDHQPLWAAAMAAGGWTVTKFRRLRELLAAPDEKPEHWLAHLGLDPITSVHPEQMRLF